MKHPSEMNQGDPPHLHLAAVALSYGVQDGALSYGEAVGYVMRAALELELFDDDVEAQQLIGLRARLERSMSLAMLNREQATTDEMRRMLKLCVVRGAERVIVEQAAYGINAADGYPLPPHCVDFLISEAMTHG